MLRNLRKPEIELPSSWSNDPRLARQIKILRACLVHDPELRFSPKELLDSDLLPPRVGDDSITETIRLLCSSWFVWSGRGLIEGQHIRERNMLRLWLLRYSIKRQRTNYVKIFLTTFTMVKGYVPPPPPPSPPLYSRILDFV